MKGIWDCDGCEKETEIYAVVADGCWLCFECFLNR